MLEHVPAPLPETNLSLIITSRGITCVSLSQAHLLIEKHIPPLLSKPGLETPRPSSGALGRASHSPLGVLGSL
jgi:hypothetical protein